MRLSSWLAAALSLSAASAEEIITIKPTWNLRQTADKSQPKIRTLRKATTATLLETKDQWRLVCIGGEGPSCNNGERGWVFEEGIRVPPRSAPDSEDSGVQCTGEGCARRSRPGASIRAVEPIAKRLSENPTGYTLPSYFPKACSMFITKKGWGEWGRLMDRAVNTVAPSCLYSAELFGDICPNYAELSPAKKNALLALTFAAKGFKESTCRPWAKAKGVNDKAVGMFQMENSRKVRHGRGPRSKRNPRWCKTNVDINAYGPQFQAECTVSIIEDIICKKGRQLNHPFGYWAKLRGEGEITQIIRDTAKRWKLCH